MTDKITKSALIVAVIATIIASLCCIGPLILLLLGIGSAWVSTLTQLAFLRPIGILLTLLFLGIAFWKLYITPWRCSVDKPCAKPKTLRWYRIAFWVIAVILMGILLFPLYAFLFY